jgi:hypothetical protein
MSLVPPRLTTKASPAALPENDPGAVDAAPAVVAQGTTTMPPISTAAAILAIPARMSILLYASDVLQTYPTRVGQRRNGAVPGSLRTFLQVILRLPFRFPDL